ncbi:hypothetical protein [Myxococcus sp. SDU36]|uniref:hypothetical protein n=1 Tax=Myxococcus sp. SDU36 TaxID=2831967 RepID=UPI0025437917|nr:hypothetical protein [Myxococcus sp. SDU36]
MFLAGVAGLLVACGGNTGSRGVPAPASEAPDNGTPPDAGLPSHGTDAGTTPDAGGGPGTPDGGEPDGSPPPQTRLCAPTAGEPRWVLEAEPISATVTCTTGHAAPDTRFAVDNLPPDAHFEYRGATSSVFPKRSHTLKFPDEDLFSEPVFGNGFKNRKHVGLYTVADHVNKRLMAAHGIDKDADAFRAA